MPLRGTIGDFGIADIFQLIGQQTKTGELLLRSQSDEVRVYFHQGAVVRAESSARPPNMLLGAMLLNAEVLTQQELDRALGEQKRTAKRIGAVLRELDLVGEEDVRAFCRLQMTETVFRLFTWETGDYEFEQTESVAIDAEVEPVRSETILIEGLRMLDEWPLIRRRIPSYEVVVERLKPLPPPRAEDLDLDLDVFGLSEPKTGANPAQPPPDADVGEHERIVYGLIEPGRTLAKLIHLSRLGEFETCRAVLALVSGGFVRLVEPRPNLDDAPPSPLARVVQGLMSASAYSVLGALLGLAVIHVDLRALGLRGPPATELRRRPLDERFATAQLGRIAQALEVYRLRDGHYPPSLDALVEAGLLRDRDLTFPFGARYAYAVDGSTYRLAPPIGD
jgi:hypothetical protein